MRLEGTIKTWNDVRGFGFISPSRGDQAVLLVVGLAGGWPGAIVAQQVLRHKSIKAPFRAAFWATVAVNVVAFVVLTSPLAKRIL